MPEHKPSPRAKRVWDRLHDWYGTRLTDTYGTVPPRDWCEVVDRTDNEQVQHALIAMRADYAAHPPTFPQFEKAFQPPPKPAGARGPSVAEQLSMFIVRNYRLTPKQLRGPWKYLAREFDAPGPGGKMRERHGVEITGVVIPADGDAPGYRVMVVDMQLEAA